MEQLACRLSIRYDDINRFEDVPVKREGVKRFDKVGYDLGEER